MLKTLWVPVDYSLYYKSAIGGKNTCSILKRLFLLSILLSLSSCYTSKGVNYLQNDKNTYKMSVHPTEYLVRPNDVLNVNVQSRDPEQTALFNTDASGSGIRDANPASLYLSGYPINSEGRIHLPIVGEVKVSGNTVEEIREKLQKEIDKYLLNATVLVKLTSFKISVLGDVKNPGTNYIYNTQATIFEALSAAGDVNLSAKRYNVKLIRQEGDESLVVNLDLTDPKIMESPYYFLHPNDVLYVETSKQNLLRNNLPLMTVVLTAISTTILVLSFIK